MGFRFFVLNLCFLGVFGLLGFNLYNLQVEDSGYYFKKAKARALYNDELQLRRGEIFFTDKNDNEIPVALNKDYPVIYGVPKEIKDPSKVAEKLSPILDMKEAEIAASLDNPESLFRLLIDKADSSQVESIRDLKPEGVYIGEKQHRFYPFGNLASQLVGFVGVNKNYDEPTGLYGLESFYDGKLKSGESIRLTIDRNLQAEAERVLKSLIEEHDAEGGSVIIQDPDTGKILTLANEPGFDPNSYSDYPVKNFLNSPIQYVYEAGSVFKPLTMTAGIDLDLFTPDTTYYDSGSVTLNGKTIENWDEKAYGKTTMTRVIERSINTGAVWAAREIGRQNFLDYLESYGFGQETGIDLPDERSGSLANLKGDSFREINLATAEFGQGTAVTPLQIVNAYSALANGGLLMRPYVNQDKGSYVKRRVIEENTSLQVLGMMESAVEKGWIGDLPGYRLAGKTGTAQVPNFQSGGYTDQYIHTYISIFPLGDPQFTMLVKLEKPNKDLAGRTVVPASKELSRFAINYYQLNPDDLEEIDN